MPITQSMLGQLLASAARSGDAAAQSGAEAALQNQKSQSQMSLEKFLKGSTDQDGKYTPGMEAQSAGATQAAQNKEDLKSLQDPGLQDMIHQGGSVKAGSISVGADPYTRAQGMGPHQASSFLKTAQGVYKPINEQLDSTQSTLELLNKGNTAADKLALINEARLAAASGGSRALGSIIPLLTGDPTMATDMQKFQNWVNNTPNKVTLQPAQRDALREAALGRLDQLGTMQQQADTQLSQQGPIVAPMTDYNGLVGSFSNPAKQKLQSLRKMQQEYLASRKQMSPQPPVSQPAIANPNPTTLDKLRGLFSGKSASPQAPQQGKVKVRRKSDGATGSMDSNDPALQSGSYEVVQ